MKKEKNKYEHSGISAWLISFAVCLFLSYNSFSLFLCARYYEPANDDVTLVDFASKSDSEGRFIPGRCVRANGMLWAGSARALFVLNVMWILRFGDLNSFKEPARCHSISGSLKIHDDTYVAFPTQRVIVNHFNNVSLPTLYWSNHRCSINKVQMNDSNFFFFKLWGE